MPVPPRYTTLMASLPPLGGLFEAREPAISRLRLQKRLGLLTAADRQLLHRVQAILGDPPLADGPLLAEAERFAREVRQPLVRQLVRHRLELRTVMAALRRRRRGEQEPPRDQAWGHGRLLAPIHRHWRHPHLGLDGLCPWIGEAVALLEADDLIGLERLLFSLLWRELDRLALGHSFDLEAVVIYVARWSLVERWSSYDSAEAARRFRQLVAAGLGRFTDTLAPSPAR
jgi:hypothetical protein